MRELLRVTCELIAELWKSGEKQSWLTHSKPKVRTAQTAHIRFCSFRFGLVWLDSIRLDSTRLDLLAAVPFVVSSFSLSLSIAHWQRGLQGEDCLLCLRKHTERERERRERERDAHTQGACCVVLCKRRELANKRGPEQVRSREGGQNEDEKEKENENENEMKMSANSGAQVCHSVSFRLVSSRFDLQPYQHKYITLVATITTSLLIPLTFFAVLK